MTCDLLPSQVVQAYQTLMNDVGVLLGGEKSKVKDEMDQVFEFEKKLASIYEPKEKLRHSDKIYHKMTVEELQDLCPGVSITHDSLKVYMT